ncbi:MAG: AsmA protein [Gammaproteobacteria bacterium]|nr:MAG: AsmA protein [Gammaproteobacteria bacterium]TND02905.1 MAG: AsmA protein [Gammaproteobacteria bacterium]
MNKILKISLLTVGGLLALFLIAVVIFIATFDPDKYKAEISALVKESTGRDLAIRGSIDLSFFPWLGVSVGEMALGNAAGFGPAPFAKLDVAEIRIEVLPLFRGKISTDTVTLRGLAVELITDKSGKTNWEDLAGGKPAANTAAAKPAKETAGSTAPAMAALAIGGVRITDARLVWDDRQNNQHYTVDKFSFETGALAPGKPFDLRMALDVASKPETVAGNLTMKARVGIDETMQRFTIGGLEFSANLRGNDLPGKKLKLDLSADIDADMATQRLALDKLSVQAMGVSIQGRIDADKFIDDPQYRGQLKVTAPEPRKTLGLLDVAIETADPATLQNIALDTEFNGTTKRVAISRLSGNLDATKLDGAVSIEDFARQSLRFSLNIDDIDLDRYLPPVKQPVAGTPAGAAAAGADAVPLDTLRALDIDGTLKIGKVKVSNMRSSDITVTTLAKDGVIRLHPLSATLYDGKYSGDIQADARGNVLALSLNEKLTGVQAAPLLKDMINDDMVSGRANVEANITLRGTTPEAARKTINGTAAFSFADGAVKGLNVAKMIRDTKARFDKQPVADEKEPRQTDFSEMSGSLQITNGLVRNDDLSVKAPLLRVGGKGTANLVSEELDYLAMIKLVDSKTGQAGKDLDSLKGLTIPLRIGGTFTKPTFKVELDEALKDKAKQRVEELRAEEKAKLDAKKAEAQQQIEQKREEVKQQTEQKREELKDKLQDKLKKLF